MAEVAMWLIIDEDGTPFTATDETVEQYLGVDTHTVVDLSDMTKWNGEDWEDLKEMPGFDSSDEGEEEEKEVDQEMLDENDRQGDA